MLEVANGIESGYLLSLATLRVACDRVSENRRRWWINPLSSVSVGERVKVGQRDDTIPQRINNICLSVPIISRGVDLTDEESILVVLTPHDLEPEVAGKYLTRQGILGDCLTDFQSFWEPLAELLDVYAIDWLEKLSQ